MFSLCHIKKYNYAYKKTFAYIEIFSIYFKIKDSNKITADY